MRISTPLEGVGVDCTKYRDVFSRYLCTTHNHNQIMKMKKTKALENALARAILTSNRNDGINPVDRAFLVILEEGNCHASHILGQLLKGWELYQIKARIEKELQGATDKGTAISDGREFYDTLCGELEKIAGEVTATGEPMVNTMHLLMYILRDRSLVASRVLAMYNITVHGVRMCGSDFPPNEDYYAEMNAMRNIRILHITPPSIGEAAPGENAPESSSDDEDDGEEYGAYVKQAKKSVAGLEKYGVDLTRAAREGRIDPVIGREKEIERLIQILGRRKKNNPVLIGEAGVGKSAIAEGLALRLVSHDVPSALRGKTLFSLDITSMVAGTKYRGQFEERIKDFMKELKKNGNVILFIDEIHTIVGAGSTQGSLDTANILKPALARGELQCIGATTLDEYRESIEHDGALERRFQKIMVEPTTKEDTLRILTHIKGHYEQHHSVRYSDEALAACVDLTERYITDRHFPDKAIDVLDEAGSKARVFGSEEPEIVRELEEAVRRAEEKKRRAAAALNYEEAVKASMQESALSDRIREIKADRQKEAEFQPTMITPEHIQEVVSMMTGIPVQNVSQSEKARLKDMPRHLESLVVGQQDAIDKVTKSVQRSRSGLKDPAKPIGVFMFVGPTGVGKTLLAKELAKWMFDRPDALVRIDMSEYSEKHNVSRLIGSPPGYVGYNEGGQLTETVRRQPYAVILFDEIEKAHPDVFNIMLQIFDEGQLTDGNGRRVDFRNTVIIMTSNVGSRRVAAKAPVIGYDTPDLEVVQEQKTEGGYRTALEDTFAPEFINRIDDVIVFRSLSREDIAKVVDIELEHLLPRAEAMGYKLTVAPEVKEKLAAMGFEPRYGARSLKRIILHNIEEPLAGLIVSGEIDEGDAVEAAMDGEKIVVRKKINKVKKRIKRPTSA